MNMSLEFVTCCNKHDIVHPVVLQNVLTDTGETTSVNVWHAQLENTSQPCLILITAQHVHNIWTTWPQHQAHVVSMFVLELQHLNSSSM